MKKFVNGVLLIDDDRATNFCNERAGIKHHGFGQIQTVQLGKAAMQYMAVVQEIRLQYRTYFFIMVSVYLW